jgi:DNA polymerase
MQYVMERYGLEWELAPISVLHGKVLETEMPWRDKVKIVPLYHPAAAIYNQHLLDTLKQDFQVLKDITK